jgi:hypothetical protein
MVDQNVGLSLLLLQGPYGSDGVAVSTDSVKENSVRSRLGPDARGVGRAS